MVSKYDVFYVIATKGEIKAKDIATELNKPNSEYKAIFNHVIKLDSEGYIKRDGAIKVIHNEKAKTLFKLISFCIGNGMNYNLMFKKEMLTFIQKAAKNEFFTINEISIHPQTFKLYTSALAKYGLLLVVSRKPLKCKLLRHHFLTELLNFFKMKIKFYEPKWHELTKEIEKELKVYKKNLKIRPIALNEIEDKEKTGFVYSSLSLEGNPLTLPETQKLISKDIVPKKYKLTDIQEVINYKKALDTMTSEANRGIKLDINLILNYHKTAIYHASGAGEIRKQNVVIKLNPAFKTCDWREIPSKLNDMMRKYDEFESKKRNLKETIRFAAFFHNEFQRIHPFIDGNSRTSRLLMLHILRSHSIPMMELPLGYFDLYLDLTKRSRKRDDEALTYLLEEIILINIKEINRAF